MAITPGLSALSVSQSASDAAEILSRTGYSLTDFDICCNFPIGTICVFKGNETASGNTAFIRFRHKCDQGIGCNCEISHPAILRVCRQLSVSNWIINRIKKLTLASGTGNGYLGCIECDFRRSLRYYLLLTSGDNRKSGHREKNKNDLFIIYSFNGLEISIYFVSNIKKRCRRNKLLPHLFHLN